MKVCPWVTISTPAAPVWPKVVKIDRFIDTYLDTFLRRFPVSTLHRATVLLDQVLLLDF